MPLATAQILKLLAVIAVVESGCDDSAVGDNGKSLGRYQIQECVVQDYNDRTFIGHSLYLYRHVDMHDPEKAQVVAFDHLKNLRPKSYEEAARIWNGGPEGMKKPATKKYWIKVQKEMRRQEREARKAQATPAIVFKLPPV